MKIITMMLTKNIVLITLFVSVSCYELKNSNSSTKIPPIAHTDMAQLFELCFANTSNPIAITENLVETFHKNLPITMKAPVIIINENFIAKKIQLYYPTYLMYILSVSSAQEMHELLSKLVFSPLWSLKSLFFVIFESEKHCERSWKIFNELWLAQLLSCIVVCSPTGNETSLYTYNPFTNRAPDPWVETNRSWLDRRNLPLTLYNQSFSNDYKICETVFFDKTKVLDGYPVKIGSPNFRKSTNLDTMLDSLNMTRQTILLDFHNFTKVLKLLFNRNYDLTQFTVGISYPGILHTVPFMQESSFIFVTQKANFQSASYEIANVFDINGAIAIIFLLLLITLLIVLHNKYQIGLAVLDVLKLLMSMGIDAPLDRLAMKITFFTGFLFVFLFSPLLEGQLFAVLTRPPTYNMESLKDLYDHKYHVYYMSGLRKYILGEQLWKTDEDMKYLHPIHELNPIGDCVKKVIENNRAACMAQDWQLIDYAVKHNLHIAQRVVLKTPGFYHTHLFWALMDRFYHESLNLQESGMKVSPTRRIKSRKKLKAKNRHSRIVDYRIIDAVDLTNLYVFMAFFQCLAVIVFGIEYIIGRYRRPRQ
ncbi:uncharacterized protein LOC130663568 [Microplitis mediator]|uniref:uncharacterized protein LOC130663568 n=1 Tax=Microplitis mediator TaxID=375433 RepID=UPI002552B298|nr:uncharacterized protein LOC130663568 [Microplitis mediator]